MMVDKASTITAYIPAGLVLIVAGYLVAVNWGCVIVSLINRRKGIDRHRSVVPLVSVFLSGFAYGVCPTSGRNWVFVVALCDIANWLVLWFPFWLLKEALQKKPGGPFSSDPDGIKRHIEQDMMEGDVEPPHSRV